MRSSVKNFMVGFGIAATMVGLCNWIPFFASYGAYRGDGIEEIGFPFVFRRFGGFNAVCEFHVVAFLLDIVIAVAFATVIGFAVMKWRSASKGPGFPVLPKGES